MTIGSKMFESLLNECRRARREGHLVLGSAVQSVLDQYGISDRIMFLSLYHRLTDELPQPKPSPPRYLAERQWYPVA